MVMLFKRDTSGTEENQPVNTWRPYKDLDGKIYPSIRDSNGCFSGIETHHISNDGVVSPSVICGYGCGFHEFITLVGWDKIAEPKQH